MSHFAEPFVEQSPRADLHVDLYGQTSAPDPSPNKSFARAEAEDAVGRIGLRRAVTADAELIEVVASSVNIHEYSRHNRGFLVYTLTAAEYRKRISDGQYVFLFEYEGEPVGFVCGYDDEGLDRYYRDETLSHESSVCSAVMEAARKQGDGAYLFLDQISVLPSMQDRGLGEKYFDLFCKHIRGPFYVVMLEAPIRNPRIDFWVKRGFRRLGQVDELLPERFRRRTEGEQTPANLRWGIYLLEDCGYLPQRA